MERSKLPNTKKEKNKQRKAIADPILALHLPGSPLTLCESQSKKVSRLSFAATHIAPQTTLKGWVPQMLIGWMEPTSVDCYVRSDIIKWCLSILGKKCNDSIKFLKWEARSSFIPERWWSRNLQSVQWAWSRNPVSSYSEGQRCLNCPERNGTLQRLFRYL